MAERRECAGPDCSKSFAAQRSTARYCSTTCRSRAARDRKAAAAAEKAEAAAVDPDDPNAKHPLLVAVRRELTDAGAVDSVDGQVALQLARRVVEADAKGVAGLIKEMRAVLAAATGSKPTPTTGGADGDDGNEGAEPEDEVTAARRAREDARKAAGLA